MNELPSRSMGTALERPGPVASINSVQQDDAWDVCKAVRFPGHEEGQVGSSPQCGALDGDEAQAFMSETRVGDLNGSERAHEFKIMTNRAL